jgi:hypothetical protein
MSAQMTSEELIAEAWLEITVLNELGHRGSAEKMENLIGALEATQREKAFGHEREKGLIRSIKGLTHEADEAKREIARLLEEVRLVQSPILIDAYNAMNWDLDKARAKIREASVILNRIGYAQSESAVSE